MKLLFDENLSPELVAGLAIEYPLILSSDSNAV